MNFNNEDDQPFLMSFCEQDYTRDVAPAACHTMHESTFIEQFLRDQSKTYTAPEVDLVRQDLHTNQKHTPSIGQPSTGRHGGLVMPAFGQ